jgi:predicted nucleic acid-binding protein
VALLDRQDGNHARCVDALRELRDPLVTVWPALVEAMYLLDSWTEQSALWAMIQAGPISIATLDDEDGPRLRELMSKYRDLPMDLADAALVHVAERDGFRRVFTLDTRDFEVYRVAGRERLTLIPAPARPAGTRRGRAKAGPESRGAER